MAFVSVRSLSLRPEDAESIAAIYNVYVTGTTVSFETEAVTADEMRRRIAVYSCDFPYLVCENPDGTVAGYCYAHPWKDRPAYSQTLETTVYVDKKFHGQGVGRRLMEILIDRCRTAGFLSEVCRRILCRGRCGCRDGQKPLRVPHCRLRCSYSLHHR